MNDPTHRSNSCEDAGVRVSHISSARCVTFILLALLVGQAGPSVAQTVGDIVTPGGVEAMEYFVYADDGSWATNAVSDMAFGVGGAFGQDLYLSDNSLVSQGRIYRLVDNNLDGDALDLGESSHIQFSSGQRPHSLAFGDGSSPFGTDLLSIDDGPNRVQRLSTFAAPGSTFASGFSTPSDAAVAPDGSNLLVTDMRNFTNFGALNDGLIYIVNQSGSKQVWANGANTPHGLWDPPSQIAMSPDGWLTVLNGSVRIPPSTANRAEWLQFKDNDNDGDANDVGESRVIIPVDANLAAHGGLVFDSEGIMYIGSAAAGLIQLMRFEDLNGDGDFWDSGNGEFDAGEQSIFADNVFGPMLSLALAPDGELYASVRQTGPTRHTIVRFAAAPTAVPALSMVATVALGLLTILLLSIIAARRKNVSGGHAR